MRSVELDLLTVANAAYDIRFDDGYEPSIREQAWALWCVALGLLKSSAQRPRSRPVLNPSSARVA